MSLSRNCRLRLALVLCLCVAHGISALRTFAQDVSPEREREAKALFEAGVEAAKLEDYKQARELFQRSRQLVVKASTLLNLAIADFKLGLVDEALFALDAIEAPSQGPEQERMRKRARKLRGEVELLRASIAEQEAQSAPEAAASEGVLTPRVVSPVSEPPTGTEVASVTSNQVQASPADTRVSSAARSLAGPRALLAVGGALGAGAIGAALWWRNRNNQYDACLHARADTRCNEQQKIAHEKTAAMAVTLSLGISAALLVTGGAFWLVRRKNDRRIGNSVSASLWGDRSALGVLAHGQF